METNGGPTGASAVLNIADDDMNNLLDRNELMAHFTHFVVPRGGGSGVRQMHTVADTEL